MALAFVVVVVRHFGGSFVWLFYQHLSGGCLGDTCVLNDLLCLSTALFGKCVDFVFTILGLDHVQLYLLCSCRQRTLASVIAGSFTLFDISPLLGFWCPYEKLHSVWTICSLILSTACL